MASHRRRLPWSQRTRRNGGLPHPLQEASTLCLRLNGGAPSTPPFDSVRNATIRSAATKASRWHARNKAAYKKSWNSLELL